MIAKHTFAKESDNYEVVITSQKTPIISGPTIAIHSRVEINKNEEKFGEFFYKNPLSEQDIHKHFEEIEANPLRFNLQGHE